MKKEFLIVVGGVIATVAAMGVGFFFNPLIAVGIVLVGSAAAGWFAGRKGSFRSFGIGLLVLLALTTIFAVCIFDAPQVLLNALFDPGRHPVPADEHLILQEFTGAALPSWFWLLCAGLALAAQLLIYLCVFNAAILFRRWYFIAGAAIVLLAELSYVSIWLLSGIGAVFAAFTENRLFGQLVLLALLIALLTAWAVCNILLAKRRNWRNFAWCAGGFAAGSFLVWGVSALSFYIYAGSVIDRTASAADPRGKRSEGLVKREQELRAANDYSALRKRGIELPLVGRGMWRGRRGKTVAEKTKRRTLEFAASAEGKAFFARNAELLDLYCRIAAEGKFSPGSSLTHLRGYRNAARTAAAQAALAHYRKDQAGVLPPLEKAEKLEQAIYENEQTILEGLVRIDLTSLRLGVIVGCGPEAPEYAAQYRAILKRLLADAAKIPTETGFIRAELQRVRGFGNGNYTYPQGTGAYTRLVNYPTTCASLVCNIRNAEANAERAAEWRKSGMTPNDADTYGKAMRRALECRAFYATALALKIYRCEKGEYPENLDALVPEILDQLPCDPLTGMPFDYRKMPKGGFMLYAQRIKSVKRMLRITPAPRY